MVPFLFLVGAVAGGLLLLLPAILKLRLRVDEVVTTLLLNFVVILFANYLLFGPWKDPLSMGWPQRSEEHTSELPSLMRISYAVFCLTKKTYMHIQSRYTTN